MAISRVKIITALIHLNENIVFYPRLKKFYKSALAHSNITIVDVGSNKGQTIDFFLKHFSGCKIYGFEPNADLYVLLCKKYADKPNVTITNAGISDKAGRLLFHETVTNETSTFEEINYESDYLKMKSKVLGVKPEDIVRKRYEVEVTTLADFLEKEQIRKVDVLKIDTEGHEYKCLLGLFSNLSASIDYIQLERHNDDMYKNKGSEEVMTKLLGDNSFQLHQVIKHGFGDFDEVIYKHH